MDLSEAAFGLRLPDFEALEEFAPAGLAATTAALERAQRSYEEGGIPIAGAAVYQDLAGELVTLGVGHNGRIPAPPGQRATESPRFDPEGRGYPTDHGETAAVRQIGDVSLVDWRRVVFATSLNPCIMCTRTLTYLWTLGLDKIVVADVGTYEGTAATLEALEGMTVLELNNTSAVVWMTQFARDHPREWNADIGMIPPTDLSLVQALPGNAALQAELIEAVKDALPALQRSGAGVVTPDKKVAGAAVDERGAHGGNPTYSAPMLAMGRAGSAVNLRESVLVFVAKDQEAAVDLAAFGAASLGACELFRPGTILSNAPFDQDLAAALGCVPTRSPTLFLP